MRETSGHYRKAYEAAQRELLELISEQERIERRLVTVRKSIQTLAALCESKGEEVSPSAEAAYLLEHSTLADEIRIIVKAQYPDWSRPHEIKGELERLGHDLTKYSNPQATIQMVLKRLVESGEVCEMIDREGKKIYRGFSASVILTTEKRQLRRRTFGAPPVTKDT